MNAQFVTTPAGEEIVILAKADYLALLKSIEELEEDASDAAIYVARKAMGSPSLPPEVSMAMLKGASLLKALRTWRDIGQVQLADQIESSQGFISDLENGRRAMTDEVRKRLASALDVPDAWFEG